jgi:hypothetical protein
MAFKWFKVEQSMEQVKRTYHKLVKRHHPERGGDNDTMKEIVAEYTLLSEAAASGVPFDQAEEWAEGRKGNRPVILLGSGEAKQQEKIDNDAAAREMLDKIVHMEGVSVEICGTWVWVGGDTKAVKDELKRLGFRFASKKSMWYWHAEDWKPVGKHRSWDMQRIRETHGSRIVSAGRDEAEATA